MRQNLYHLFQRGRFSQENDFELVWQFRCQAATAHLLRSYRKALINQIFDVSSLNGIHTKIRFREKNFEQPRLRNRSISAFLVDFRDFFLEETFFLSSVPIDWCAH